MKFVSFSYLIILEILNSASSKMLDELNIISFFNFSIFVSFIRWISKSIINLDCGEIFDLSNLISSRFEDWEFTSLNMENIFLYFYSFILLSDVHPSIHTYICFSEGSHILYICFMKFDMDIWIIEESIRSSTIEFFCSYNFFTFCIISVAIWMLFCRMLCIFSSPVIVEKSYLNEFSSLTIKSKSCIELCIIELKSKNIWSSCAISSLFYMNFSSMP